MSEIPDLLAQGCLRINFMPRLAQLPVFFLFFLEFEMGQLFLGQIFGP